VGDRVVMLLARGAARRYAGMRSALFAPPSTAVSSSAVGARRLLSAETLAAATGTPPLRVVFEDQDYFFVHKPSGLVVAGEAKSVDKGVTGDRDPAAATSFHEMVKAHSILHYDGHHPNLLHRLDRETSGLMVYAKSEAAAKHFLRLQDRPGAITKEYLAVVSAAARKCAHLLTPCAAPPVSPPRPAPLPPRLGPSTHVLPSTLCAGARPPRAGGRLPHRPDHPLAG
jgi:hypothetical protein